MIDLEKRRRVMERSLKLGHCICNPKKPCPCDLFTEKDLCLCAGERPEDTSDVVPLTSLVKNAGCASKINQNDLKRVLVGLPEFSDPRVLVGRNTCDDAGIYKLDEETALVQTVDVFTPGVDDPYTFGQIAAANSLSDVYAMGGQPLTALAIIGFPIETLSPRVMTQILRGGLDKLHEAGVPVIGGHSINDLDVKYGFAVTGRVHPDRIITNAAAQPGDVLILTKPLGVGIVSFARQLGRASDAAQAQIAASMTTLNKRASELMIEAGVRCATDVTGFGLLGHLSEMVCQSKVTAELWAQQVPVFDEVLDYVQAGLIAGAVERNREYASQYVQTDDSVCPNLMHVLYDPQTSGGLLIAVPEARAADLVTRLRSEAAPYAALIGRLSERSAGRIMILNENGCEAPQQAACCCAEPEPLVEPAVSCCEPVQACCETLEVADCGVAGASTSAVAREAFGAFMGRANAAGALSVRDKELLSVALSILSKCEPCVKIHLKKAREAGLSEAEIEEAAWLAVAFGGAPTMMFYNGCRQG